MATGIKQQCSRRYTALLRVYIGMLAFISLCAAVVLGMEGVKAGAFVLAGVFMLLCVAAAAVPLRSGRVSYTRTGGCLRIEKGLFLRRMLVVNRSDIRYSELSNGPVERRLGVCTVTFFTGGGKVRLRGLGVEDGKRLHYLFGGGAAE